MIPSIADYAKKSADFTSRAIRELKLDGAEYTLDPRENSVIRFVFVGQYSAGKSSILKMLTGNEDIEIGAGITTQKTQKYEWNGIEVVDTPGINTELRPDHDVISYKAISDADMLVFVVTSHLFDEHIAEHFRKIAVDQDKGGEMILVVNKMEEAGEGNSEWQQSILREDLKKVIEPYTPEQLHLCFLDAQSYLDSFEETDPEIVNELRERSGFSEFVETLNAFVSEKQISAKLTTNLYKVNELLQNAIQLLEPKSTDQDVDSLTEYYLQQRHTLVEGKGRIQQEISNIFSSAAIQIRNIGLDAANLIEEGCDQNTVETELKQRIHEAEVIIDSCQNEAVCTLEAQLNELGQAQDAIAQTPFSKELEARLSAKFDVLPEGVQALLNNAGESIKTAGLFLSGKAYKEGIEGGLKLSCFSGSTVHEVVLKAGHMVGFKFKPWQAVKIAKGVGVAGKVLGVFGVGLNVFMQIKSDQDEEKVRKEMRKDRQNIRSQFNEAASELQDFGKVFVAQNVIATLDEPIHNLDIAIQNIRAEKKNRSVACQRIEALQRECYTLIHDIHRI